MSKQTETPAFDYDVFDAIDHYRGDWRQIAADMGCYVFHRATGDVAVLFGDSVYWKQAGIPHMTEMGEHISRTIDAAVSLAALFGYCLGKTAPASIEDIEGWPERAWALAGFGKPEEPTEQSEGGSHG